MPRHQVMIECIDLCENFGSCEPRPLEGAIFDKKEDAVTYASNWRDEYHNTWTMEVE